MDANPDNESGTPSKRMPISRRSALRYGTIASVGVFGGMGALAYGSDPVAAALNVDGATTVVNTASASSDDGVVTDVTLRDEAADDTAGIDLVWQGFETTDVTVTFGLEAQLTGSVDGETNVAYEELLTGSVVVGTMNGEQSWDWMDVFGTSSVSLFTHTNIDATHFESSTDGGIRERDLGAKITATADHNDATVTASSEASAILDVTNISAEAGSGGTVDTNIST